MATIMLPEPVIAGWPTVFVSYHYSNRRVPEENQMKYVRWFAQIFGAVTTLTIVAAYCFGLRFLSVQTSSMKPLLQPHDMVITRQLKQTKLPEVGTIVSYVHPKTSLLVTHRVNRVLISQNMIVPKGDNEDLEDIPVAKDALRGVVIAHVGKIGYLLDAVRTPAGLIAFVYAPALTVVLFELRRLVSARQPVWRLR